MTDEEFDVYFEQLAAAYPKRKGRSGNHEAKTRVRRLIDKEKLDPSAILENVQHFAVFMKDQAGTEYIPMISTYFGKQKGWYLENWVDQIDEEDEAQDQWSSL